MHTQVLCLLHTSVERSHLVRRVGCMRTAVSDTVRSLRQSLRPSLSQTSRLCELAPCPAWAMQISAPNGGETLSSEGDVPFADVATWSMVPENVQIVIVCIRERNGMQGSRCAPVEIW